MITLFDLFLIAVIAAVAWLIWQNAGFRDRALGFVKQHCKSVDVQLLDDTISLQRIRLKRGRRGYVVIARYYEFEFSVTGERRYKGHLTLLGPRIESIELEPHRFNPCDLH